MQDKIIKVSLAIVGVILIVLVLQYVYAQNSLKMKEQEALKEKDLTLYIRENNDLAKQSREAYLAKDYKKALELSSEMLEKSKTAEEKAYAEFSVAKAYFDMADFDNGTKVFFSVFNNTTYDEYTRVAALNTVMQQYKGSPRTMRPFLERGIPELKDRSEYDTKLYVYQKMYAIHPTTHSTAFIGSDTILKLDKSKKEEAEGLFLKFANQIDEDIKIQQEGVGSRYLVPNLIGAKAAFFVTVFDKFDISSVEEISTLYEASIKSAQENLSPITEQFAMINYMNFLAVHGKTEKALTVFDTLSSQTVTKMVSENLKFSDLEKEYPGIKILFTKNEKVKKFIIDIKS